MKSFSVSVIIPVYNCESFIQKAIESALLQPEVFEIVVVNDGSTDNTQSKLEKLQKQNEIIEIFYHKNKSNKGRSASRNLGIKMATNKHIAFLDADDYYLPNRFSLDKKIFEGNKACDGVYNAIGVHFYKKHDDIEQNQLKLTTITKPTDPEELFETLISGKHGHFSIDGLTVKKDIFKTIGFFNEALVVSEDTDVFWKMALKCNLYPGLIEQPVAIRGVHITNVFNRKDLYTTYETKMYQSLFFWSSKHQLPLKTIERFLERLWIIRDKQNNKVVKDMFYWFFLGINSPKILFTYLNLKYFPLIRLRKKLFSFLYN